MAETRSTSKSKAEVTEVTPISEAGSIKSEVKSLSPEYLYTTDQRVEDFGDVPFQPIGRPRNDLSPPSNFQPPKAPTPEREWKEFCKQNPNHPKCIRRSAGGELTFCQENPSDPRCTDEQDPYSELGIFQEEVRYIFDPESRSEVNRTKKPVSSLYEQGRDDTQLDVGKVVRTTCRCKDGTTTMGWLDTRTGQKDCSSCKKTVFSSPSIYKNYKTSKPRPNFQDKKVPLRKQVGVSHFGDVEMKGCQTGNAERSLESVNAVSTLNNVINIDTVDSRGGANVTTSSNMTGLPFSMYDNDPTDVYGISKR